MTHSSSWRNLIESVESSKNSVASSEDWKARLGWLHSVVGELWTERGLFPGMPSVLSHLGLPAAITFFRREVEAGREQDAAERLFGFLDGASELPSTSSTPRK